ncbi:MAG: PrsW family glutamic-type intramembrane protease [Candidatus Paceibacterota bacterium]|jgi:RsiW-degrading membrane proteinase PrsW (M82 family)
MDQIFHSLTSTFYALLGGIVPAVIWLFFWTREDKENPEPRNMIALAFVGGAVAVLFSLLFEKLVFDIDFQSLLSSSPIVPWIEKLAALKNVDFGKFILIIIFAPIIEETLKFISAFIFVLRSKDDDEPIDPIIYMITTALGFAALENVLFLIEPISSNDIGLSIVNGNMRFIGATLLHTISSASIGIFIGFHFFNSRLRRIFWIIFGVLFAIILHSGFNFFMLGSSDGYSISLEIIWFAVIMVLLAFERIKHMKTKRI